MSLCISEVPDCLCPGFRRLYAAPAPAGTGPHIESLARLDTGLQYGMPVHCGCALNRLLGINDEPNGNIAVPFRIRTVGCLPSR